MHVFVLFWLFYANRPPRRQAEIPIRIKFGEEYFGENFTFTYDSEYCEMSSYLNKNYNATLNNSYMIVSPGKTLTLNWTSDLFEIDALLES